MKNLFALALLVSIVTACSGISTKKEFSGSDLTDESKSFKITSESLTRGCGTADGMIDHYSVIAFPVTQAMLISQAKEQDAKNLEPASHTDSAIAKLRDQYKGKTCFSVKIQGNTAGSVGTAITNKTSLSAWKLKFKQSGKMLDLNPITDDDSRMSSTSCGHGGLCADVFTSNSIACFEGTLDPTTAFSIVVIAQWDGPPGCEMFWTAKK